MGGGDHSDFRAFVLRVLRAYSRRVAHADVEDLAELLAVQHAVEEAIVRAVAGLRAAGRSWGEIAAATGTTRQAAQQRYGVKIALLLKTPAPVASDDAADALAAGPEAGPQRAIAAVAVARSA